MNSYKLLLFTLMLSVLTGTAQASHIVGGTITYKYLGTDTGYNQYEVTVELYEDCLHGVRDAIVDDAPIFLNFFDSKGAALFAGYDSILLLSPRTLIDAKTEGRCIFFPYQYVCLEKAVFTKVYSLPATNSSFTIVMQRCCMSASILNLVDPAEKGITLFGTIPPKPVTNSSAIFRDDPPFFVRINRPFTYDHSATDADGDSLSYEFCQSYSGGSAADAKPTPTPPPFDPDTYSSPFTYAAPMSGAPAIQIDPVTGLISGTPNSFGRYFISVCCHEWRAGVQINTIQRLFQIAVTSCETTDIGSPTVTEHELKIFPNPASGIVNISADTKYFGINITDLTGRVVYHYSVKESQLSIPTIGWAKGVYFVRAEFENGTYKTDKIFVQ